MTKTGAARFARRTGMVRGVNFDNATVIGSYGLDDQFCFYYRADGLDIYGVYYPFFVKFDPVDVMYHQPEEPFIKQSVNPGEEHSVGGIVSFFSGGGEDIIFFEIR